ncbi:MAG: cation-translocating P-type ATPase [Verrucomicrobia bacterium]|nr:cation-translocating P-type ATPase [Verrucomicrobiota bacterium]
MSLTPVQADTEAWRAMAWRAGVCLAAGIGGWALRHSWPTGSGACYGVAYVSGGWDLARSVGRDLRALRFDTEFLMLLVAAGAVVIGAWAEGALLLVLFASSAAMEEYAAGRTRREIGALLKGAPKVARRLVDGREVEVTVQSLEPHQMVRVTANEQVPVDLEITRGESACDESMLTGEADPVSKHPGDTALAGTLNLWGVLEGQVLRGAGDSALQRIIRLIHEAGNQRAPIQRFTDRFGTRYTALVVGGCIAWFFISWRLLEHPPWVGSGETRSAFYRAMTLLVVLSPCALVLSVPSAILSAIACGARHGVLFRGGAAVETLAEVSVVAMDKTGTLTEGALHLDGMDLLQGTENEARRAAASLARLSNHPVSRAIARELRRGGVEPEPVDDAETVPAQGIRGRWRGQPAALGSRAWMEANGVSSALLGSVPELTGGGSVSWLCAPGILARLRLRDQLRPVARQLVDRLRSAGLRTVMLTGDHDGAARLMGEGAGVDEVRSGLRPEDKVAAVRELRGGGVRVAMIGDGVNDAPVLAAADVGLAMGARGSDAALEVADIVLMNDRLENVVFARDLSRRARSIIRQNLILSLGTMAGMAVLSLSAATLPLSLGVAAHEGSTVIVVLNSLRLLWPPRGGRRKDEG